MFEEEFPWVKYEDLWRIIKEIIKNERFEFYNWKKWHIEWTEESIKVIKLWNLEIIVWIFHDKENNTIEYRFIREITAFPEWIRTIWSNPTRLYLESQNQVPKLHYVGNADIKQELNLVPAIKEICKQHRQWIESLMKSNIWFLD
jgi:hypothetical protein